MVKSKIKIFFSSGKNKLIIIISLAVITTILLVSKFFLKTENTNENYTNIDNTSTEKTNDGNTKPLQNLEVLEKKFDSSVDSILSNFGIKKEWISTTYNAKLQKSPAKTYSKDTEWFTKSVLIPKDLTSIEVNLDLSAFINSIGLASSVNEDIITKDITLVVHNPDTIGTHLPLAKISIIHSDKVSRESATVCIILNNIGDYKQEEIDKLLLNKSEFSFVFPRNLDEIDTQNKLLQNKKDVLINLTIGTKDNYDTDFNAGQDEKAVREKVKSFSSDFPTITKVILTKSNFEVSHYNVNLITGKLNEFNIKVFDDSSITKLLTKAEEDLKENTGIIINNLKTKASLHKNIIVMLRVDSDEFEHFYDEILVLKKLGYKFYNLTDYMTKQSEKEKQEEIKLETLKSEQEKQKESKKTEKKKTTDKKKQPEKKLTPKKKTEPKKPETKPKTNTNGTKKK